VKPSAKDRYNLHVSMAATTFEKFEQLRNLLSHTIPSGDVETVLERAFDLAIAALEKRKFAATDRPRTPRATKGTAPSRHIPAHVKRAVRERDENQCTYVSPSGHRCTEHRFLEYDHILEFARGGEATVENIRLRCRGHNQYTAEKTYGAGFMSAKRAAGSRESTQAERDIACASPARAVPTHTGTMTAAAHRT
jgi:5-methylcytosine-specific restriction endonuclease McrA